MSQCYSTGTAFCSVKLDGISYFLGTPERPADIDIRPYYEDVINDLAGGLCPFDMMFVGQDALITFDLTAWNAPVLEMLKNFGSPGLAGAAGTDAQYDRGSLMLTENKAWQLFIGYPRSALPSMSTLPSGYRFVACFLQGPHKMTPGLKPYKERCVIRALSAYNPDQKKFGLYDHEMSGAAEPN